MKMLNLQTEEFGSIPTSPSETESLKRKCFNEGWWKGFVVATGCIVAGCIIGTVIANKILKGVS